MAVILIFMKGFFPPGENLFKVKALDYGSKEGKNGLQKEVSELCKI